jgi:glucan phosphoethanolaminetransferase (alkaline phosphatase superfamily)
VAVLAYAWLWIAAPDGGRRFIPRSAADFVQPFATLDALAGALTLDALVGSTLSPAQAAFRFGARRAADDRLIVLLVIGESSRRQSWQLFGYARETTPELGRMKTLIAFDDVTSSANLTINAVPLIITRARAEERERATRERSLVSAFSEAGFKTAWLSMQDPLPYAREADLVSFHNPNWMTDNGRCERDLVPLVALAFSPERSFFGVLHTIGSHYDYRHRVPRDEAWFSRTPEAGVVDLYDDSIRHTDRFLTALIREVRRESENSVVLFVGDHGENLTDVAHDRRLSHGNDSPSAEEISIPMLIWCGETFRARHPAEMEALEAHRHSPISQAVVFHTLLDLAGVEIDGFDRSASLASKAFRPEQRRVVLLPNGGTIDAATVAR